MRKCLVGLLALCVQFVTMAAAPELPTINLKGTVVDDADKPLKDAMVTLLPYGFVDRTDSLGNFMMVNLLEDAVLPRFTARAAAGISLRNGILRFSVGNGSPTVAVSLLTLSARQQAVVARRQMGAGSYELNLASILRGMSSGVYYVNVQQAGQPNWYARITYLAPKLAATVVKGGAEFKPLSGGMAKTRAAGDTLVCLKTGYTMGVVGGVDLMDTTVKIKLAARSGQPAETKGLLVVYADDALDSLFVNGTAIVRDTTVAMRQGNVTRLPITVSGNKLTLATRANNVAGWDGGISAVFFGENKTVLSDSTWKCSFNGADGWTMATFDDNGWSNVSDKGEFTRSIWYKYYVDSTTIRTDNKFRDLEFANPRAIWSAKPVFVRKTYTAAAAMPGYIKLRAWDCTYTLWLNGTQIGQSNSVIDTNTKISKPDSIAVSYLAGENVFALRLLDTASTVTGLGMSLSAVLYKSDTTGIDSVCQEYDTVTFTKCLSWKVGMKPIARKLDITDTTWFFSLKEEDGWKSAGFTQSAQWTKGKPYSGNALDKAGWGQQLGITGKLTTIQTQRIWHQRVVYLRKTYDLQ